MMATYKEDNGKDIGSDCQLSWDFNYLSENERTKRSKQLNLARAKRFSSQKDDDADGPQSTIMNNPYKVYAVLRILNL